MKKVVVVVLEIQNSSSWNVRKSRKFSKRKRKGGRAVGSKTRWKNPEKHRQEERMVLTSNISLSYTHSHTHLLCFLCCMSVSIYLHSIQYNSTNCTYQISPLIISNFLMNKICKLNHTPSYITRQSKHNSKWSLRIYPSLLLKISILFF